MGARGRRGGEAAPTPARRSSGRGLQRRLKSKAAPVTTEGPTAGSAGEIPDSGALEDVALRLDYLVSQITPAEFRWQDANYDRDSALGRELLFLIADNEWSRATAEKISVTRSDSVETRIEIDIDLDRITHEAFRGRTGHTCLPILVLPPPQRSLPDSDPLGTLTVMDASGTPLATLPDTDVTHRIAAAITEIIVNMALPRLPAAVDGNLSSTRDQRLMLSAAVYRLLRGDHVPSAVMSRQVPPRPAATGPLQRLGRAGREVSELLEYFSGLLTSADPQGQDDAAGARRLTERAIRILRAFAESTVVVVAAEFERSQVTLTVTVPTRALHLAPPGSVEVDGSVVRMTQRWRHPDSWRWLHPDRWNWILPRARLQVDLLLPSAEADRNVEVSLPEGVALDPSIPRPARAELDIKTRQPPPIGQLRQLVSQLVDASQWPAPLYQCLADLARAKASAALESLREHRVGAAFGRPTLTARESTIATRNFRAGLEEVDGILADIAAEGKTAAQVENLAEWQRSSGWLQKPIQRRAATEAPSPDVVVARARLIEDLSQRATPARATIQVNIAVTDSEHFSIAWFSGWMSALLMTVVLGFFITEAATGVGRRQVSPEVLAIVLTLFSAIQAGRIEQPDRSTLRGLLAQAGSGLIVASILPAVILAVALAFSTSAVWAIAWAGVSTSLQLLLQALLRQRLRKNLARGRRQEAEVPAPQTGLMLYTDAPDYSHADVLHSEWWRSTTADALMVGRQAYGYVAWQRDGPHTLSSLLQGGRPASEPLDAAQTLAGWLAAVRRSRRAHDAAPPSGGALAESRSRAEAGGEPEDATGRAGVAEGPHPSLLEQPANVLALQRSSTGVQSVTFAVFRDEPQEDWRLEPGVIKIVLDPGRLAPTDRVSGIVGVYLGLPRGLGLPAVPEHPVTKVLQAAARRRLTVLEVQLPVPPPTVSYADLLWARVQIGLYDDNIDRLTPILQDIEQLATGAGSPATAGQQSRVPVVGVQTVSEGIPRILNPRETAANPGPAAAPQPGGRGRLVLARDLDVVAASGLDKIESSSARNWRVMAICADWRMGIEASVMGKLDPGLQLAGLTSATLYGKTVMLLLGHRPHGRVRQDRPALTPAGGDGGITVCLDKWQSRTDLGSDLGAAGKYPLLRVHMRTPDRPGATLEVLESLRTTLKEMAPESLDEQDWNVSYARAVVASGNVALIQLTAKLAVDPETTPTAGKPVSQWGPAEFSMIERRALALAAHKMSAGPGGQVNHMDLPENTVISVDLVKTPDLDRPSAA